MKVRNRRNNQVFETSQEQFRNLVEDKGNGYLYEIVEDETPIEVKSLKEMKLNKGKPGKVTEVSLPKSK